VEATQRCASRKGRLTASPVERGDFNGAIMGQNPLASSTNYLEAITRTSRNHAGSGQWNDGMLECWSDGILG
jgi:hypothetical protein